MLTRVGPGSSGYNYQPEFADIDCVLTLANNATCAQGQVLLRDCTKIPGSAGADMVVLPTNTNGVTPYGVYQGAAFTNTSGASATYQITVRKWGQGVVLAQGAGGAVNVDSPLIVNNSQLGAIAGSAALNANVGMALATGATTTKGSQLIANLGAAALVNAHIDCC